MMLVLYCTWYLLGPWQACVILSFCRIVIVLSLSLSIYRNSVGTVFLIVSFPNDNTETFGTISTTSVHILRFFDSIPAIFLSTFRAVLADYSFCSNHTIHIQTGVHSPMLSGVGNDTHQTTSQSGPTAVGAGGPFLPKLLLGPYYYSIVS